MSSVLQPILEKGILDHSIIHRTLMEYLTVADQVVFPMWIALLLDDLDFNNCCVYLWSYISKSSILKSSAADVIQQLSGPLLVRMIHTRDGSRVGILCIKHGSAKVCWRSLVFVYLLWKNSKVPCSFCIVICCWSIYFSFLFSLMVCFRRGRKSLKEWKVSVTRLLVTDLGVWWVWFYYWLVFVL